MNKRLRIAKNLLSNQGVIFVSIDENEVGALRLLGDEIFLPKNFVGQWNWFKSATPPALSKKVKRTIEYILCWQSSGNDDTFRGTQKVSKSNDPFTKPQNTFKVLNFPTNSITCSIKEGIIPAGIYGTSKFPNELLDDIIVKDGKILIRLDLRIGSFGFKKLLMKIFVKIYTSNYLKMAFCHTKEATTIEKSPLIS